GDEGCERKRFAAARLVQPNNVVNLFHRGAHAPRVLVSAPSPKLSFLPVAEKFAMAGAPSPAREARALPGVAIIPSLLISFSNPRTGLVIYEFVFRSPRKQRSRSRAQSAAPAAHPFRTVLVVRSG